MVWDLSPRRAGPRNFPDYWFY